MHKALAGRIKWDIREIKWDGKEYDVAIFPTAEEQLAFASKGENIIDAAKDLPSSLSKRTYNIIDSYPEAAAYNIGVVVAAYKALKEYFPNDKTIVQKAKDGFDRTSLCQKYLVNRLEKIILDSKADKSIRYGSVQWLERIGGNMVVPPLQRAKPIQFDFSDHDIVDNVMKRLGIQE